MIANALARSLVYPAPPVPVSSPPEGSEEIELPLSGGETVVAWAGEGTETDAPMVLFFHGNGENLETQRQAGTFEAFRDLGVGYLAVDYPGYGRSSGEPSEESLEEAADAALEWSEDRWPHRSRVSVGWSLGAAVAIGLAARAGDRVQGLVAMSAWTRLAEVAKLHFPAPLVRWILSESYDSLKAAENVQVPALVVHGGRDEVVPRSQGQQVADVLADSRWVPISTAGHNDLLAHEQVWNEVGAFLRGL